MFIKIASLQLNEKEEMMKKIGLILVVFAFWVGCASTGRSPGEGDPAPYFSVVDVSGNEVRLTDFKEKKNIVLIFYDDNN